MSPSIFPKRRADGSFSVAVRYAVLQGDAIQGVRDRVAGWVERKETVDHLDVAAEFIRPPYVDVLDSSVMQVVFDCVPPSALWKGLMVELASELNTVNGIKRLGFWDLVAGVVHPASVEAPNDRPSQ